MPRGATRYPPDAGVMGFQVADSGTPSGTTTLTPASTDVTIKTLTVAVPLGRRITVMAFFTCRPGDTTAALETITCKAQIASDGGTTFTDLDDTTNGTLNAGTIAGGQARSRWSSTGTFSGIPTGSIVVRIRAQSNSTASVVGDARITAIVIPT